MNYATCSRRLEIADNKATDIDKSIIVGGGRPASSFDNRSGEKEERAREREIETRGDSSDEK